MSGAVGVEGSEAPNNGLPIELQENLILTANQLLGSGAMETILLVVAVVAVLMLVGQYFAGRADYYLAIENPRPLDENEDVITSKWWGFLTQSTSSYTAELAGQGLADVRIFATRKQMLVTILTCGWKRSITIAWRGNAGQHPLGHA